MSIDTLIGQLQQWRSAGVPAAPGQSRSPATSASPSTESRAVAAPAPPQAEPVASRMTTAQPVETSEIDSQLYQLWQALLDAVGRASAFTRSYLLEAHPVSLTGDMLTIGFDPESDRQKYFVTDSGITVVTRDYSLFENPVTVDYFTSE